VEARPSPWALVPTLGLFAVLMAAAACTTCPPENASVTGRCTPVVVFEPTPPSMCPNGELDQGNRQPPPAACPADNLGCPPDGPGAPPTLGKGGGPTPDEAPNLAPPATGQ
jgi:hypothetical protein